MKTIVFHGFAGGPRTFALLDAQVPDLPGHGAEPPPRDFADAIERLARHVDGQTRLIGYSLGARLALALALLHPPAELVLISGTAGIDDEAERAARRALDARRAEELEANAARFFESWEREPSLAYHARLSPDLHEAVLADRARHVPAALAATLRTLSPGAQPSLWSWLSTVRSPVRVIAGQEDAKFAAAAQRLAASLPQARLSLLPCGHAPHLERARDLLEALQ